MNWFQLSYKLSSFSQLSKLKFSSVLIKLQTLPNVEIQIQMKYLFVN